MIPDFEKLIIENNQHSMFLDVEGMVNAMKISYELGKKQGETNVLDWLSQMSHLSDNIKYIIEEYKNQTND